MPVTPLAATATGLKGAATVPVGFAVVSNLFYNNAAYISLLQAFKDDK
ncbi:hypothetical protein [Flavisolibacter ginsenosidimutans]|nr:hypothetical protein [Flavisolibacter ginsenosidimutans]